MRKLATAMTLLVLGCGSSTNKVPDAGATPSADASVIIDAPPPNGDGGFAEAAHLPFPSVTYQGGRLLSAPHVISVTFGNDPMATDLATYGQTAANDAWWDVVRADYCPTPGTTCLGDGPAGTAFALNMPLQSNYDDSSYDASSELQMFLAGLITTHQLPAPDANSLYVLYFPLTTTITLDGSPSCGDYFGYHNAMMMGSQEVLFAVVPECAADQATLSPPLTTLGNTTLTASHEIIETATDGSDFDYGYYLDLDDASTYGWDDIVGGEVADLCVDMFGLGGDFTMDGDYVAQRIWSTSNAAAGKNPCIPIPAGEVYFNAAPSTAVLVMNVGESKTIEVDAFSDAPIADWTMNAQDWTSDSKTYLSFAIAGGSNGPDGPQIMVNNGSKVQVTVTLVADPVTTDYGEVDGVITSANGSFSTATHAHFWPFIVVTPAGALDGGIATTRRHVPGRHLHGHHHVRRR